ncbi:group II intron maturase-specific domain-containing protein [Streptomyces sp. NPDC002785]|uniref:group II intron maturase-specific domain-containing protein n=1 Tax=Streptomyces sp. NPDC002785 TaxID=3154543 RepID=UPI00332C5961
MAPENPDEGHGGERCRQGEAIGQAPASAPQAPVDRIEQVLDPDDGFVFLGFHIQSKSRGDGRRVVLTIPAKTGAGTGDARDQEADGQGMTSLSLAEVPRKANPVLRGWAGCFRSGASKKTFSCLGWYAWWRMLRWIRREHPHLTWKQLRRSHYGADRIAEGRMVLYNPAKTRVERYRYRGARTKAVSVYAGY